MNEALLSTLAALVGAIIGGLLSVLASWLAQRVQAKSQLLALEIRERQELYRAFIEVAAQCYADALQKDESEVDLLAKLFAELARIRVSSSSEVLRAANRVVHQILKDYANPNHTFVEVRDLLDSGSIDLFSAFGEACRTEFEALRAMRI